MRGCLYALYLTLSLTPCTGEHGTHKTTGDSVCDEGWLEQRVSGEDVFCYMYHPGPATWQEGRDVCRQAGAELTSIHGEEEREFVRNVDESTATSTLGVWVGLMQVERGRWAWSDQTPVNLRHSLFWQVTPREPYYTCAALTNDDCRGCVKDDACDLPRPFVCRKNRNECALAELSSRCRHHLSTCEDTPASFLCSCPRGFDGDGISSCSNADECRTGRHNCGRLYSDSALCHDTVGSFSCECGRGYSGDGVDCVDENECHLSSANTCPLLWPGVECVNTVGSYSCECVSGWRRACTDLSLCSPPPCLDVDECEGAALCLEEASCVNSDGSFSCICQRGFTGDGRLECRDIDEEKEGLHDCDPAAVVYNIVGSFLCVCPTPGYTDPAGDGLSCENVDECLSHEPCGTDPLARCVDVAGSFDCSCSEGYRFEERRCRDVDECTETDYCLPSLGSCRNFIGYFSCECYAGAVKVRQWCRDRDECGAGEQHRCVSSSGATCHNLVGSYSCECGEGYQTDAAGVTCSDVDECAQGTDICKPVYPSCSRLQCNNWNGSFTCTCSSGMQMGEGNTGENNVTSTTPLMTVVVATAIAILVIVVIAACFAYYRKTNRETNVVVAATEQNPPHPEEESRKDSVLVDFPMQNLRHPSDGNSEASSIVTVMKASSQRHSPEKQSESVVNLADGVPGGGVTASASQSMVGSAAALDNTTAMVLMGPAPSGPMQYRVVTATPIGWQQRTPSSGRKNVSSSDDVTEGAHEEITSANLAQIGKSMSQHTASLDKASPDKHVAQLLRERSKSVGHPTIRNLPPLVTDASRLHRRRISEGWRREAPEKVIGPPIEEASGQVGKVRNSVSQTSHGSQANPQDEIDDTIDKRQVEKVKETERPHKIQHRDSEVKEENTKRRSDSFCQTED